MNLCLAVVMSMNFFLGQVCLQDTIVLNHSLPPQWSTPNNVIMKIQVNLLWPKMLIQIIFSQVIMGFVLMDLNMFCLHMYISI